MKILEVFENTNEFTAKLTEKEFNSLKAFLDELNAIPFLRFFDRIKFINDNKKDVKNGKNKVLTECSFKRIENEEERIVKYSFKWNAYIPAVEKIADEN